MKILCSFGLFIFLLLTTSSAIAQGIDPVWLKQYRPCTWGLATAPDGSVYCVQPFPGTVIKFDSNGDQLFVWGSDGTGPGEFAGPRGVATDSQGNVFIADESNNRIQQFNSSGVFQKMWGNDVMSGTGAESSFEVCPSGVDCFIGVSSQAGFTYPHDVAVDPRDDSLIVADTVMNRVVRLDPLNGVLTPLFDAPGQVLSVSMDAEGSIFITLLPNVVSKYTLLNGTYSEVWSNDLGYFFPPTAHYVAVDSVGNIYVSSEYGNKIQKFDSLGNQIMVFGWGVATGSPKYEICTNPTSCLDGLAWQDGYNANPGQFNGPVGVAVDSQDAVLVIDAAGRLQKFDRFGPEEKIVELIAKVITLNLQQGISNSLDTKLDSALDVLQDLNDNNDGSAINKLNAFINEVEAQRGDKIPHDAANELIEDAQEIINLLMD